MSHITRVAFPISDLECLEKAGKDLNGEFCKDQRTYKWFGQFVGDTPMPEGMTRETIGKCEHAIRFAGATYEVGVAQLSDGSYELRYDYFSAGGLPKIIGDNANLLRQRYTAQLVMKDRRQQGYRVWEERNHTTGRPRIIAERER